MRSQVIFYTQNKTTTEDRFMKLNTSRIRAYARTMDAGMRTIEEVQEEYRVSVYIELIATYDWNLEMVDERYVESVKKELEIIEA